ncbi:MAG: hypothetical protein NC401_19335 [Ruminococcus sp.]|nr:hypothetical protein [Ruminococcus sp.]
MNNVTLEKLAVFSDNSGVNAGTDQSASVHHPLTTEQSTESIRNDITGELKNEVKNRDTLVKQLKSKGALRKLNGGKNIVQLGGKRFFAIRLNKLE